MDEPNKSPPLSPDIKNVLPDVVHSQHIPAVATDATNESSETLDLEGNEDAVSQINENETDINVSENSEPESISEHIPSRMDYSISTSDMGAKIIEPQDILSSNFQLESQNSQTIPIAPSTSSDHQSAVEPDTNSPSWPADVNLTSEVNHISAESPANLAPSSELSKVATESKSDSSTPQCSVHKSEKDFTKMEYMDSLNEKSIDPCQDSLDRDPSIEREDSLNNDSLSGSEEIIKLDIRGSAVPRFPFQTEKIIFGPVPECSSFIDSNVGQMPIFPNLLSPLLVGAGDGILAGGMFKAEDSIKDPAMDKLFGSSPENSIEQKDLLVEEVLVDETKAENRVCDEEMLSMPQQPKSLAPEETGSFNTMSTEYKTIEGYNKLVQLEEAITKRDELIEELTISLQRSVKEQKSLREENEHLGNEVQNLQHLICEKSQSEHDTIKAQLSDLVRYESMLRDDSTKFYSAITSSGSSAKTSIAEQDKDQEEVTVNYSRSDLKSMEASDEFQTDLQTRLGETIDEYTEVMEENSRNTLRETLLRIFADELGKVRIEYDTEVKELERMMQQERQASVVECRRLRELVASVRAGDPDVELLRKELADKHEREMENLRTYFEKKCSDMERSYSEDVWRGRCERGGEGEGDAGEGAGPGEGEGEGDGRRRARSADLALLSIESSQLEQAVKQVRLKYERQIEEMKVEHCAALTELQAKSAAAVATLEEQITQLKAHIQTTDNTESNMSVYQQDIDLELEKKASLTEQIVDGVRQEVIAQLQEQIQVLLSDPDAELSSWPLELVALRDKIYDARPIEKECSSLREELTSCEKEKDKWKQRRNISFDQNRQIEEVTKERDGLKRVATSLQRAVAQLAAYCVAAEHELNQTVLGELLTRVLPADYTTSLLEDSSDHASRELSLDASARCGKRVHFAPDLRDILAELHEDDLVGYLEQQRDLSVEIKRELENSLLRLRNEAHELLELSAKVGKNRPEQNMLESGQVEITELVEEFDARRRTCDNCEDVRKSMEEAMSECLQRESLLGSELEAAHLRIASLMTCAERAPSIDLVAEGYGQAPSPGCSPSPGGSPRALSRLRAESEALLRERDDLTQQLEAANRQLRSTRQFVEEQAAEREAERDEFASRLAALRADNSRLAERLHANARILHEVEQLEAQTREMNQIIKELEERKSATDDELKASTEKISLLRDIIANLENQLEQKSKHESEVLAQLAEMRGTIDERDGKMRELLGELELLKSERADDSSVMCAKCCQEDDESDVMEKIKEETRHVERALRECARRLESAHEPVPSAHCDLSEDVSRADLQHSEPTEPSEPCEPREPHESHEPSAIQLESPPCPPAQLARLRRGADALARAADMALKRIADLQMQRDLLKDVAQEVRAERDVLQARMSEQALRISSLAARLDQQRHSAEALAHDANSRLAVQLHDANAEVQRLREEIETKEKQLARLKQSIEEKDRQSEQHDTLYGNSCNPKDKVIILERELSSAQARTVELESLARGLEADKEEMARLLREAQRNLAEKEAQLHELLALKLDEEQKSDQRSELVEGKTSARTLSDIVSISDFDEQDLQMRRAEIKAHNLNITGAPFVTGNRDKSLNRTLPPEPHQANMSSLNEDNTDHFDLHFTPRADSLPINLTSTQHKELLKRYKRNVNETAVFGTIDKFGDSVKHSTAVNIPDNCSMYPNRDVSDSKNVSVEPKKIDFSLEPSHDNKTNDEQEFTSLRELGIVLDIRQENFSDIVSQLKHEIKKSKSELNVCKSELKTAEEQLCEFPALKDEVEELKGLLENTMAAMETDKKFYNNQLDQFTSNKKLLEQRLTELTQEVNDKTQDLQILKEDILRRENMILELAKEKRNLTNKMTELEMKIDELQSKNLTLAKYETESLQMREKVTELQKLQQLVSEKNQQIDSLNQHLDRFDDLQRCLNDKTEEFDNLKEAFEEKSNELFQMQDAVEALNRDLANVHQDNNNLNLTNKELRLKLTKLEKEQENQSLKLQTSESELERVNSLNSELSSKIDELKQMADKLKDKETEIEILQEDINTFHEEVASLKEQLKLGSRSPSPRNKGAEDKKPLDRQARNDKKQLVKIRKQIYLLQHELDFNKKELNEKTFSMARARLEVSELQGALQQGERRATDLALRLQREQQARLREESNVDEVREKLRVKSEQCVALEREVAELRELIDRSRGQTAERETAEREMAVGGEMVEMERVAGEGEGEGESEWERERSPTAELERALRDQLDYSHRLDEHIMEQILSASSDNEEIPRLALNSSKSSSSSCGVRVQQQVLERLQHEVGSLQARLRDKDALIAELYSVRDKAVQEARTAQLKYSAERDNSGRLQLLLDAQRETADSLQSQDSNMISILKKRLEAAMLAETESALELQQCRARLALQQGGGEPDGEKQRLQSSVSSLRATVSSLRARAEEEARERARTRRQLDERAALCRQLTADLADLRRLKHETGLELVRVNELLNIKTNTIAELERKIESLTSASPQQKMVNYALMEIENQRSELSRELTSLRQCLVQTPGAGGLPGSRGGVAELPGSRGGVAGLPGSRGGRADADRDLQRCAEEKDSAIRYLHCRCVRLESCRKALVWQKRYLQQVLAGYREVELRLGLTASSQRCTGKRRFRSVVSAVVAAARLAFLVRRRMQLRALGPALTRVHTPTSQYLSVSPPAPPAAPSLVRRALRLNLPQSPSLDPRQSPCNYSTPTRLNNGDPFMLNSPRSEASAYISKLELVSRCLTQTMEAARDVP